MLCPRFRRHQREQEGRSCWRQELPKFRNSLFLTARSLRGTFPNGAVGAALCLGKGISVVAQPLCEQLQGHLPVPPQGFHSSGSSSESSRLKKLQCKRQKYEKELKKSESFHLSRIISSSTRCSQGQADLSSRGVGLGHLGAGKSGANHPVPPPWEERES